MRIGPGVFVAIGGPSGVGKDTLIRYAAQKLKDDPRYYFVTRTITRPSDGVSEDHTSVTMAEFERLVRTGAFAVSWVAHGLNYGLPSEIDDAIAANCVVIANISRSVLPELRRRYARVVPVAIAADPTLIRDRLVTRGRETSTDIQQRSTRVVEDSDDWMELQNSGPIKEAGEALVAILRERTALA